MLLVCILAIAPLSPATAESKPTFEVDIQPLLNEKCGKCHSQTVRKGGLDLSSMAALRRGGESGEPLLATDIGDNLLWIMLDGGGMPPEDQPQLDDAQLRLIREWLEAGAPSDTPATATDRPLTQHDVLPIVLLRCTTCHGPRLKQGGLDLRTRASMLRGGQSGPALVPGDPDASPMIQRIESEACPPTELLLKFFVKRPPDSEVETLRRWIVAGAPEADIPADVATTEPDPLVTDEERRHWAFQPPKKTTRFNSVDAFLLDRLRQHGLEFAPEADRDTLIRRAYIDLIGMPPTVEEWKQWRDRQTADWYEQMIDHLLASPHYGERWGRYWLDVAGYADSEGGTSADPLRPVAWKYRDYVVRAFNDDKPYDRFLLEQLAGDELIDYENAPVITPEIVDNLVATGFLRMGIDETGSRTMNFVPERLKVISDAITVVSSGLMGLTMECARCHSHKYDPIPQRDYYRLKAVFQGALDEHDWSSFKTRTLQVGTPEHQERLAAVNPPLEAEIKKLAAQQKRLESDLKLSLLRHHYPEQSDTDNQLTLTALRVADNTRTLQQRTLVERLQRAEVLPDDQQPETVLQLRQAIYNTERDLHRLRRQLVPPLTIRALWDLGRPSPTYTLRRGEHNKPGPLVGPGVPSVLTDGRTPFAVEPPFPDGTAKTGRRLAFARWLTRPDHPLTSRVMVNRVWYHHFGAGLIKDLENFGRQGEPPSHPELLDWLAVTFTEREWSVKELHRLIMTSQAYRQSSRISHESLTKDPQNRLFSHMSLRRLDAEALRDSLLFVSGKLDPTPGGWPDAVSVDRDGLVSVFPTDDGNWRRSIYLQHRRTELPTMLDTFDYPQMGPNCITRTTSNVSTQALLMMNNGHIRELAASLAERVAELTAADSVDGSVSTEQVAKRQVELVYQMALSRSPTIEEQTLGIASLRQLQSQWQQQPLKALTTYCHTIFNSAAFLYVD